MISHQVVRTEHSKRESLNGRTSPVSPSISTRTMKRCRRNNTDIYDIPQRSPSVAVVVVVASVVLEAERRRQKPRMYPHTTDISTNHHSSALCVYPIRDRRFGIHASERRAPALFTAVAAARRARTHTHTHARDGTRFACDVHVVASDGWDDDDDDAHAREWVRAFGVPNARGCGVGAARARAAPRERCSRARGRE